MVLHVEVCRLAGSPVSKERLERAVLQFLERLDEASIDQPILLMEIEDEFLTQNVNSIRIDPQDGLDGAPIVYIYTQDQSSPVEEHDEEQDDVVNSTQTVVPCMALDSLWDTLYYDQSIKTQLLEYASTAMLLSDKGVDTNILALNRVILLHGPPGTGKTSLCRALANKLAIRFSDRYACGYLVEINSHSLFSKWFSESGKLVGKMFSTLRELVETDSSFVCILIDEVESLTAARKSAMNGTEPTDSIRVVNALLTQIDQMRRFKNVLIMATSNITEAIDVAFLDRLFEWHNATLQWVCCHGLCSFLCVYDKLTNRVTPLALSGRADIRVCIPLPNLTARYDILRSCLVELIRIDMLVSEELLDYASLQAISFMPGEGTRASLHLLTAAKECDGFSGRFLRKVPFLTLTQLGARLPHAFERFVTALTAVARHERTSRAAEE
eukprot:m.57470 g.57470  ORF g.57470 m.57470 type:complete len:441 (+) comp11599_c1_seq1:130-1452(+)